MTTTDLAARLRAVVEERLAVARAARGATGQKTLDSLGRIRVSDSTSSSTVVSRHIALNDPADVILACERDLAVLARHERFENRTWVGPGALIERDPEVRSTDGWWTYIECRGCEIWTQSGDGHRLWPCDEIRDLATRYRVDGG